MQQRNGKWLKFLATDNLWQFPLTVAWHAPLECNWWLRFGLGTDLDPCAQNRVSFDYRENGRMSFQGLYEATESTRLVNSLTVSGGIERAWKGWLFRASPFISLQLRAENLYWGGQIQVLYKIGRH